MDDPYAEVKKHFKAVAGVTVNEGRGAQGIKLQISSANPRSANAAALRRSH